MTYVCVYIVSEPGVSWPKDKTREIEWPSLTLTKDPFPTPRPTSSCVIVLPYRCPSLQFLDKKSIRLWDMDQCRCYPSNKGRVTRLVLVLCTGVLHGHRPSVARPQTRYVVREPKSSSFGSDSWTLIDTSSVLKSRFGVRTYPCRLVSHGLYSWLSHFYDGPLLRVTFLDLLFVSFVVRLFTTLDSIVSDVL